MLSFTKLPSNQAQPFTRCQRRFSFYAFVATIFLVLFMTITNPALSEVVIDFSSTNQFHILSTSYTTVENAPDHQTVNITIQNNYAVWYDVKVTPSGSGVNNSNIPSEFVLQPNESRIFSNVRFNGNNRLSFFADATSPSLDGLIAIDAAYRLTFSDRMPTEFKDAALTIVKSQLGEKLSIVGDVDDFRKAVFEDHDIVQAIQATAKIVNSKPVRALFKSAGIPLAAAKDIEFYLYVFNVAYFLDIPVQWEVAYIYGDLFESVSFQGTHIGSNGPQYGPPLPLYNNSAYISDGTPVDGTALAPLQPFIKSWVIKNTGTTTWGTGYRWVFDGRDQMGAPDSISVPTVRPGETWTPSVNMRAPTTPRSTSYVGYWRMQAPDNTRFGTPTHVNIKVPTASVNVSTFVSEDSIALADGNPGFLKHGPSQYWYTASGVGDGSEMLWTYNNDTAHGVSNYADWRPNLPSPGAYEVYVFIPRLNATTNKAHYAIYSADGQADVFVNQASFFDKWVSLGVYRFNAGSTGFLRLVDQTNEGYASKQIGVDAAKWEARGVNSDIGFGSSEQNYFLECFNRSGGRGIVGSPINDAHTWGNVNPVTIQDFRDGSGGDGAIIDNFAVSHSTAYYVHGDIWSEYAAGGGPDSPLGRPLSDEYDAKPSWSGIHGRESLFEGGVIESCIYGTYTVSSAMASKYSDLNRSGSMLGFPTSEQTADTSSLGTQGQVQSFEGGSLYASALGTYEVHGGIVVKYGTIGFSSSVLGFPTSDERDALQSPQGSTGRLNQFEGGTLYYSYRYGGYPVYAAIKAKHDAAGGTTSFYGFPIGDPISGPLGLQQAFEGGTIYADVTVALQIVPNVVTTGSIASTGTVTINRAAPANGFTVTLVSSDSTVADIPDTVTVPQGATSVSFQVFARQVNISSTTTISTPGYEGQATFTVNPQTLVVTSFTISPGSIAEGTTATAIATFNQPAPDGNSYLIVKSSKPAIISTPLFRSIPQGATSMVVTLFSHPVTGQSTQTISCWVLGPPNPITLTAPITITPSFSIASLSLNPSVATGGITSVIGTVTLGSAAPDGGLQVNLAGNDNAAASVPTSVTVAQGTQSATFTVSTSPVTSPHAVIITASGGGSTQQASLAVYQPIALSSFSIAPLSIVGGGTVIGTVSINRPAEAGGTLVTITSANKSLIADTSVQIPQGATSASLSLSPGAVTSTTSVTLTASANGSSQFSSLTVIPGQPNLSASASFARSGTEIIATVNITNSGTGNATNVLLSNAILGSSKATTALPVSSGTIPAGMSQQIVLHFSGNALAPGIRSKLQLDGSYTGGSYSITIKAQGP